MSNRVARLARHFSKTITLVKSISVLSSLGKGTHRVLRRSFFLHEDVRRYVSTPQPIAFFTSVGGRPMRSISSLFARLCCARGREGSGAREESRRANVSRFERPPASDAVLDEPPGWSARRELIAAAQATAAPPGCGSNNSGASPTSRTPSPARAGWSRTRTQTPHDS
jgi:hypothetical protein